jgi:hypothetical protein
MRLMKVTVYCFLAELHGFNVNEFYSSVFDTQTIEENVRKMESKFKTTKWSKTFIILFKKLNI